MNAFNPHGSRTTDGVLIVPGLRVYDNNLDIGTVEADDDAKQCERSCNHAGDAAQVGTYGVFTDHKKANQRRVDGCACGHDHWFRVVLDYIPDAPEYSGNRHGGFRSMNGERLCVKPQGMVAADRV